MRQIALVSLDTVTGAVRRYTRGAGNVADAAGVAKFEHWAQHRCDEQLCWEVIQDFRIGHMPRSWPEPDNDPLPPMPHVGFASL